MQNFEYLKSTDRRSPEVASSQSARAHARAPHAKGLRTVPEPFERR